MKNRSTIQTLTFVQTNPDHLYMKLNMKLVVVHAIIHCFGSTKLTPCKNFTWLLNWLLIFKNGTWRFFWPLLFGSQRVSLTSYFISLIIVVTLIFGGKLCCSLRHSITFSYLRGQTYCQLLFFWIQFWMTIELMIFLFDTTNIH
jgi:hypothetical protein